MKSVKNKIICKTIEVRKDLERNYLQIMCVVWNGVAHDIPRALFRSDSHFFLSNIATQMWNADDQL